MFYWIKDNLSTIIVLAVLATGVALVIVSMVKNKKKGKTSCGSGCANCPMSGGCHRASDK